MNERRGAKAVCTIWNAWLAREVCYWEAGFRIPTCIVSERRENRSGSKFYTAQILKKLDSVSGRKMSEYGRERMRKIFVKALVYNSYSFETELIPNENTGKHHSLKH